MDLGIVGANFYSLMMNLGEDYTLTKIDGEEYTGKISLIANTKSSYMLSEREYLLSGEATFPDIESQTTFRGCYFKRAINPEKTYIMVSTIPEQTNEKLASVYVVQCNEKVDLAYLEETQDEKFDTVTVPVKYAENVDVFFDSTLQKQKQNTDGNFDAMMYFMQMPARYTLCPDQVVIRKAFKFNEKTKQNEIAEVRYRVQSIDLSMTTVDENGQIYGIMDVQMSLDMRV